MSQTTKQLLAAINKAKKSRSIEIAGKIEVIKLENELDYINSAMYEHDMVEMNDNSILSKITDSISEISSSQFVKFQEFNYGYQGNALISSIKTVMLQKKAGFEALEDQKFISKELTNFCQLVKKYAGEFPDAIGRNTYFDKLSGQIIPGEIGNADAVVAILRNISRELEITTPVFQNKIIQERMNNLEEKSQYKAHMQYDDNQLLDPSNNEEVADITYKTA